MNKTKKKKKKSNQKFRFWTCRTNYTIWKLKYEKVSDIILAYKKPNKNNAGYIIQVWSSETVKNTKIFQ